MPNAEDILGDFLPRIERSLEEASRSQPGCPERLAEAMRYSLLAPGKRLRPALVLMAAEACGGPVDAALPAAAAVEMIHAYSLVHDDLPAMDDDDLRRGRPTCHRQFDEATAILVGDALLARAFEVLASGMPAPRAAQSVEILARAAGPTGLVGGQADDLSEKPLGDGKNRFLQDESMHQQRLEHLESIHRRKTGALFAACLELGAVAVGAEPQRREILVRYAVPLGLAFQIIDDLLDHVGSADEVGKRTGKDLDRGKLTYPGLIGVEASRRRAEHQIAIALEAAALLGAAGERLNRLARFVLQRSR